ncbi:putative ADF actin-binding protein [Encephalitozoon intestinalis ATCC 50506]|uniref:ADF actin-binding protein n=1 Tax=Encephalitozoon intestinalis (strain ATCC 50506) TaxID=876142 RepID=E0S9H3_ENCIT|nr:putative ADF actin-binding protein [Encephalitozoon intestinalis ATCC 50506]ADM12358.1 putative ADF actin-binding protein [Encephalitozoon intestinalis ATCC 50506]UTX46190.1 GMF gamma [Encephalitozoon intestinalis]
MSLTIPGLDLIRNEIEEIKSGNLRYTIANLSIKEPISLSVLRNGGRVKDFDYKRKYTIKELQGIFEEFSESVNEQDPCLVVYDFIHFDDDGIQKNTLCLISYIPEHLVPLKKVAYSTNALNLKELLDISVHISIKKKSDLIFDNIAEKCAASRMK